MQVIRVYRNINAKDKFLGLELADGCLLLLVFFLAFSLNKESLFVNALILFLAFFGLRVLKRGKPDGYMLCLTRYALTARLRDRPRFDEADLLGRYPYS